MAKEIEKENTYLLSSVSEDVRRGWECEFTKDTYYPPDTNNPQLRLRQRGEASYFLTKKYPKVEGDLSTMIEETIHLSEKEFSFLEISLRGLTITKNRYKKQFNEYTIEIDEYIGDLAPLIVLDIEWEGERPKVELKDFDIIKEITNTAELAAGQIAGKRYEEIKKHF